MTVDDSAYARTYLSLRTVGEHILSAARHASTGRIGLAVVSGGIATPPYGPDNRWAGVIDGALVVSDDDGRRETTLTSLAAAGEFVGIAPGAPASVYTPTTVLDLHAALPIDSDAFAQISSWYERVAAALAVLTSDADPAAGITLWPEHFDVATRISEVNYGGLGGDSGIAAPYAYVGPATSLLPAEPAGFWNASFGAVMTGEHATSVDELVEFFQRGRREAAQLT